MSTGSVASPSPSPSSPLPQSLPVSTSASTATLMSVSQTTRCADCRKFSPNIFNKSKCSHCFRQREEHSATALECNRASRKISKCGYLFVAPDWDFSNPLYRTKRWQRRWFVLYDDGELSYSVDEHPETVPQACIDMTKVLEVSTGEDVTGHKNSIAITAPDRVTFVKGTCPEESKWWHNVLVSFPKAKGRHKRNATFPGGQPKTLLQTNSDTGTALTTRTRHNSYHKDAFTSSILISRAPSDDKTGRTCKAACQRSIFTNRNDDNKEDTDPAIGCEDEVDIKQMGIAANAITGYDQNAQNAINEITSRVSPPRLTIEDIRNDEKTIKDIANTITNLSQQQKCRWSTTAVNSVLNSHMHHASSGGGENSSRDEIDFHRAQKPILSQHQPQQPTSQTTQLQPSVQATIANIRPKTLTLTANSSPTIVSAIVKKIPTVLEPQTSSGCPTSDGNNNMQHSNASARSLRCKSSPRLQLQLKNLQQKHHSNQHRQQKHMQQSHERGDPDGGCNLDDLSANYLSKTAELRISPPAEEAPNSKRGWLMKQDNCTGDWTKHWFILSGAALLYYRDPVSEERGVLDGVLDVNSLSSVGETTATRTYAFQLTTWDQHRLTLACLSPNSRNSWMAVLRSAAGLNPKQLNINCSSPFSSAASKTTILGTLRNPTVSKNACTKADDVKSEIEKDFIKAQRNHEAIFQNFQESSKSNNSQSKITKVDVTDASPNMIVTTTTTSAIPKASFNSPTTPLTPKSAHFSSDEEYRTASEGGRRDSVEGGSPLSPSSPKALTLMRAKDRLWARSSNYQRLQKRSRSSPPSSRRSTIDSVGSDELSVIHPVQEELCIDKELQLLLSVAEKERNILRDAAKDREARMVELLGTLERTEQQLTARAREVEEMRESLTTQLDEVKQNADDIVQKLSDELEENKKKVKSLEARLAQGIYENEMLDKRLRELEGCSPSGFGNLQRIKFKRMDSLRDLTQITTVDPYCLDRDSLAEEYTELKSRFEKAVNEIRAMKRELKESQNQFDNLEISYASLKQDFERRQNEEGAQLQMMAERIQDLTLKYSSSERQVRTLKQKLTKCERRRSLSLKGKEQLPISKDLEIKVATPETNFDGIEHSVLENKPSQGCFEGLKQPRKSSRRRSLENSSNADTQQFVVRVTDLEKRYEGVASTGLSSTSSIHLSAAGTIINNDSNNSLAPTGSKKLPDHLIDRLRCLENVLITSKDRLEQSLQQLQSLRSPRTRRSVSPITDRKDSYRYVERCVVDVVKLIRETCETCIISGTHSAPSVTLLPVTNPVKVALTQLEGQLRCKLSDLLKQRRVLRERNELTNRKRLELLAERIAFESVCFGRLRESVVRAEQAELFGERQTRAEVAETSHLMTMLKAKLSNKCTLKPSGTVDILAGVLARRLVLSTYRDDNAVKRPIEPVDKNILDDLLRQQNELNVIARRYKNHAMENLAFGLAAETISYISSNDLVQGAVQEAWRQAQETVNAELVQSEIAHIMMRNAERFESAITPSFGYTLTAEERLSFEKFADAVYEALRKEMEVVVTQLTHCYEDAVEKMKRDQWRLHMEQERKASEDRHLLSEFADIVAHKALVDARISVLCGDFTGPTELCDTCESPGGHLGLTALQKYEDLFEELSKDLQIDNPNDILAEADFQFMCNQYTGIFLNDRQVLSDISAFLSQLEDSLFALHFEATSATSISRSDISIESLQDVCRKCSDLRHCADQILQEVHRKLNAPCQICLQVREKLCNLQHQHKSEILQVQQSNDDDMNALMHELDSQRNELQSLEAAKRSFSEDLRRSEKLIEKRELEVDTINQMLRTKEEVLRLGQRDQLELLSQLDEQTEKLRLFQDESEALIIKCARQDEEYAVLLQERDCSQSALAKEKERSRRFEKRIELLELEHGKQLECLQEAYRDQLLSHCSDFSNATDEESFRQRYQAEIEQLRTLCEKGLSAMESSHRRIVGDLEEKHKQEIERLLVEKETALAEETQATLAALDAMRKAHQSEVQREIARFKKEFLKQFQRGENTPDTKEEELEELRQEILSFSEKYSIKCVENAALEEKLRSTNQKLKNVQQMQQIELRNKQFRAHLSSDNPATDSNFVQGLNTSKEDAACRDSEV